MNSTDSIVAHNRRGWDNLVSQAHALTKPVSAEELGNARKIIDPVGWVEGDLQGRHVLCLAAGGGRFSALFAALNAIVTVVDISPAMLETDRAMAERHNFKVRILQADMGNLSACLDAEFDLIMQPVSTTYVSEPRYAFAEAARVLKPNGVYISFHKQPINLQASLNACGRGYLIEHPSNCVVHNPPQLKTRFREAGTIEHAHSLQTIVGGICRAGFVIEDFVEPQYGDERAALGSFEHRCSHIPPYIAVKARKVCAAEPSPQPVKTRLILK